MNSLDHKVSASSTSQTSMPNTTVNAQRVADTLAKGNQVPESTIETLKFGLTLEEKSSIKDDITAKKPISNTPAYRRFLKSIFLNKSITFPYLVDYDDTLIVVSALSDLFGKPVRLPTKEESIESLKQNSDLTGYRDVGGVKMKFAADYGCAWCTGEDPGENSPYACHYYHGYSGLNLFHRSRAHSVIPVFV